MTIRLVALLAMVCPVLLGPAALAATQQQKMETCKFGADNQKLTGAARKSFMANCMANRDSPRGKPVPAPKPR
jgi:hypothetical protein